MARLWVWTCSPARTGAVATPITWPYLRTRSPRARSRSATLWPRGTGTSVTTRPPPVTPTDRCAGSASCAMATSSPAASRSSCSLMTVPFLSGAEPARRSRTEDTVPVPLLHQGQDDVAVGLPQGSVEDLDLDVAGVAGRLDHSPQAMEVDVAVAHHPPRQQRVAGEGGDPVADLEAGDPSGGARDLLLHL